MQCAKYILITFSFFLCFAFVPQSLYGMLSDEILRVMSKKETEGYTDEEKEKQKRYLEYERLKAPGVRMQQYLKTRFEKKPESKSLKDFRIQVIQSFKNNIIKKIKDDPSKKTAITISMISAVAPCPNGKWIAIGSGRDFKSTTFFRMWQINKENIIQKEAINQPSLQDITKPIQSLAFSPDSKNIAIGSQASSKSRSLPSEWSDLLLYKIDGNGVLSKEPQKLDEYSSSIDIVTFDPTGKKMLSIPRNPEGIIVWNIDENGNASKYISLFPKERFDTVAFNSDGTMLVAAQPRKIFIWYFNENKIVDETPIVHEISSLSQILNIAFIPHNKKCIIAGQSDHNTEKGLIICDLSDDKNIKHEKIESYPGGNRCDSVYVSSDGHMIIASNDTGLYFIDYKQ